MLYNESKHNISVPHDIPLQFSSPTIEDIWNPHTLLTDTKP
jgi:hypothetical protein